MDDIWARFWSDLVGRLTGPMTFRLILQPIMASIAAYADGVKDAKNGRPAYFWALFTQGAAERKRLLDEGWKATLRIILLGVGMDFIYQIIVFGRVYPAELIVVAFVLAFLPYLLLRGPINRIARRWVRPDASSQR